MEIFFTISIIAFIIYCFMMFKWFFAWTFRTTKGSMPEFVKSDFNVSVIVAVRNEEYNIIQLLKCLENQDYKYIEVIVSDDFSEDNTELVVKDFISQRADSNITFKFIKAGPGDEQGKKSALKRAIAETKSEVVITTDADCIMGNKWVSSILIHFGNPGVHMIIGSVIYYPTISLFGKLQALDVAGLSISSAASLIADKPLMCNGANFAFLKKTFDECNGYSYGSQDASGDDTYLMLSFVSKYKSSVIYNGYTEGIVFTKPLNYLNDFIDQRLRWASKIKRYKETYIRNTGIFLFFINCILIVLIIFTIIGIISPAFTISMWIVKMLSDLVVLYPFLKFTKQRKLLLLFLPLELIYPVYTLVGGILAVARSKYQWKGRRIN